MYCLWFGSSQYIIVDAIKFRMINLTLISILFGRRHRLNGLNGTKKKENEEKTHDSLEAFRSRILAFRSRNIFYKRSVHKPKSFDLYSFSARRWCFQ